MNVGKVILWIETKANTLFMFYKFVSHKMNAGKLYENSFAWADGVIFVTVFYGLDGKFNDIVFWPNCLNAAFSNLVLLSDCV